MKNEIILQKTDLSKINFGISKGSEIAAAIESRQMIRNLDNLEPVKQSLRYVFTLIGLRAENIPSDVEKGVLLKFIFDNFGNIAPEEIRIAFELAIAGQFDAEIDHYQRFSSLYLSKVLRAYIAHRQKVARELQMKKDEIERNQAKPASPEEIQEINAEFDQLFIVEPFFDWKKTRKLDLRHASTKAVFSALFERHKVLKLTNERIDLIKERATLDVDSRLQDLKNAPVSNKAEKTIRDLMQTEKGREELIRERCCELSILEFFELVENDEIDLVELLKIEI